MIIYNYDHIQYPFYRIVSDYFNCHNLHFLHLEDVTQHNVDEPGKDNGTIWHKKFYESVKNDSAFLDLYHLFLKNFIKVKSDALFQKIPTFRVQLPNGKAVGGKSHRDGDYNHPEGEVNFLIPLTYMSGSSSLFTESEPGLRDFKFVDLNLGNLLVFDGRNCEHGNAPNMTGLTRISFDFRVISLKDYNPDSGKSSVGIGSKFINGDYYSSFERT